MIRCCFLALLALPALFVPVPRLLGADYFMYVGAYTPRAEGISVWRFDAATGKFTPLGLAAKSENPSFLAAHPNGRFLYAVNEISNFEKKRRNGAVSAFAIDPASG